MLPQRAHCVRYRGGHRGVEGGSALERMSACGDASGDLQCIAVPEGARDKGAALPSLRCRRRPLNFFPPPLLFQLQATIVTVPEWRSALAQSFALRRRARS